MKILALLAALAVFPALAVDRSTTERRHFAAEHPCPVNKQRVYYGCAGFNIDHKVPICAGGADVAANMQWLSVKVKKSKDRIENAYCACVQKHGAAACPRVEWVRP